MKIEPIPNELLGDEIIVQKPADGGWSDCPISNVRAEITKAVDSGYPDSPKNGTRLTVWYDYVNSTPQTDIECGMRIIYGGEIFNVVNVKLFRAVMPHHLKITAIKLGEYAQNEEG